MKITFAVAIVLNLWLRPAQAAGVSFRDSFSAGGAQVFGWPAGYSWPVRPSRTPPALKAR